jgi:hypothetical protein
MRAVTKWRQPRNTKEVFGFLTLTGYYRKCIQDYAQIALPLYRMCKVPKKDKMGSRRSEQRLNNVGTVKFVGIKRHRRPLKGYKMLFAMLPC